MVGGIIYSTVVRANAELPPLAGATTIAYAFSNVSNDEEVWVIIRYKYYMWIT
jgi:hypothetical protein